MSHALAPHPTHAAHSGEVRLVTLNATWLERVLAIEHRAYSHPWSRGNFDDSLVSGYWLAGLLLKEQLAAYMVVMPGVDESHLLNITVAPEFEGQGLARVLLNALFAQAQSQGHQWVWLEVRASNVHAREVYRHVGFAQVGRRPNYYPCLVTLEQPSGREDALVMSYRL